MARNSSPDLLKAPAAGAGEKYVTACPFCGLNLDAAARRLDSLIRVYDSIDPADQVPGRETGKKISVLPIAIGTVVNF
jgi:hypothetical protein